MSRIKALTTIRERCEFWGCIFPQNRKTTYIQGFSQYSFILLMNLLALFSFSLLHTGNKPELSHFNMLVMLSVQKHFRLLVLNTSFLSHVFSRTGSLQNNFENNLFHIAAVLYTRAVFNHSCVLLVQYYNLILIFFLSFSGVWFACRAAVTALHFSAWMSSWCGCAQQNSPWNFWTNISHVGTSNLQATWVRSSLWPLFSMFLVFYCSYFKITVVLGVLFAWHM